MDERIFTLWAAYVGTPVVVLLHAVWLRLRKEKVLCGLGQSCPSPQKRKAGHATK